MLHRPPFDFQNHPEAEAALEVASRLHQSGHHAVIAGGAVRDLLLGQKPKDYDVATDALPETVLSSFKLTKAVGLAFGVVLVNDFGPAIEVATFRCDMEYKDGRHPEGVTFTDAQTDAQRRDFSINGLFYEPHSGRVIDHVGGVADLELGCIRAIGVASDRFAEDYLRMLRAIRFAIRLNFKIEDSTWLAIREHAQQLQHIAKDRIHEELLKTLQHHQPDRALQLLSDSGLLQTFIPEPNPDMETPDSAQHSEGGDIVGFLSLLLLQQRDKVKLINFLDELRCTNPTKQEVSKLIKTIQQLNSYEGDRLAQRKRRLRLHKPEHLFYILERSRPHRHLLGVIRRDLSNWSKPQLFPPFLPQGKDLIQMGVKPGPEMGHILYEMESLALEDQIHNREEADAWLSEHLNG